MFEVRRFPQLPYIIGHRGAKNYAPENTISGFQKGLECGAHLVECDVHLSQDGHVVVIHDDTVNRTTKSNSTPNPKPKPKLEGFVHQLTLKEMKSLDAGNHETIPTLDETLTWVKNHLNPKYPSFQGIVIEIKTCKKDPRPISEPVLQLILKHQIIEHCMVISFDHAVIGQLTAQCPTIATGLLYASPDDLEGNIFDLCHQYRSSSLWPSIRSVTSELTASAHQKHLGVFTWVANTEKDMKRMIQAGVDGIGSDVPDRLRALVS